ncbi:class I SAM-dependent methyltransferase [Propionicicella superfundia]|uniref:class I SAM-dependent methyltransferase n=1 Tax=Propionicicella superfundia TaxID=348582 RepID=UPI0003FA3A54|nr:class I SAM-dependent methyltransferase [Propionicicella superfundia]
MDAETAELLVSPSGAEAIAAAEAEDDPGSLAAATRLRRSYPPELAAAALTQAALRRRAGRRLGPRASGMVLTPDGLEQATRWDAAAWRAGLVAAAGVTRVIDLCCGLGTDAMAFAAAGLDVVAVERDPATAVLARHNLAGRAEVLTASAEDALPGLAGRPGTAVFCDPARRTSRGRSWDVADLSPPWPFLQSVLAAGEPAVLKLGPGLPARLIPAGAAAVWASVAGDLVECGLWRGLAFDPGAREAVLLPAGDRLRADGSAPAPAGRVPVPGDVLYEPDPAVIRSGAVGVLARELAAAPVADQIAYLLAPASRRTSFATAFAVTEVLPWKESALRRWVAERGIGTLEIKRRGLDVDPAALRGRLRPRGDAAATLILTPTAEGAVCLVVRRLPRTPVHAWHSA